MVDALATFIYVQSMLLPIMVGIFLGIRSERRKKEELYYKAISTVNILSSRGKYGRY